MMVISLQEKYISSDMGCFEGRLLLTGVLRPSPLLSPKREGSRYFNQICLFVCLSVHITSKLYIRSGAVSYNNT